MVDRTSNDWPARRTVPESANRDPLPPAQATLSATAASQVRLLAKLAEVVAAELQTGRKQHTRRSQP